MLLDPAFIEMLEPTAGAMKSLRRLSATTAAS